MGRISGKANYIIRTQGRKELGQNVQVKAITVARGGKGREREGPGE